jgi:hypothetical protein
VALPRVGIEDIELELNEKRVLENRGWQSRDSKSQVLSVRSVYSEPVGGDPGGDIESVFPSITPIVNTASGICAETPAFTRFRSVRRRNCCCSIVIRSYDEKTRPGGDEGPYMYVASYQIDTAAGTTNSKWTSGKWTKLTERRNRSGTADLLLADVREFESRTSGVRKAAIRVCPIWPTRTEQSKLSHLVCE